MNWIIFALLGAVAYVMVSIMGGITGAAATSGINAGLRIFHPYALALLIVGNIIWAAALYYGLKESRDALPMLIAVGVLTSFIYSVFFLKDTVTAFHLLGLALVLAGIYFLA